MVGRYCAEININARFREYESNHLSPSTELPYLLNRWYTTEMYKIGEQNLVHHMHV